MPCRNVLKLCHSHNFFENNPLDFVLFKPWALIFIFFFGIMPFRAKYQREARAGDLKCTVLHESYSSFKQDTKALRVGFIKIIMPSLKAHAPS